MSDLPRPRPLAHPRAFLASARLLARRLRLTRWAGALVVGAAVALWVSAVVAEADQRRAGWSTTTDVWVLTTDVGAGSSLEPAHVQRRSLPVVAVPDAALRSETAPEGRRLRVAGHRGEVLIEARIAPSGASSVTARLPDGTRGIVVPTDEDHPFEVGDEGDLFDLVSGRLIEAGAPVVAVATGGTTFAVDADRVGTVIAALAGGGVVPALVP